ncbi:hypothetical protein OKA05_02730 [Luteolibacter arcticus]|uniref:Uncharacterized protein n=1 Tax=Luteolibacter arcticus TaxID=1581411 RepID=A0ABT3GCU0_9BACT|nr:hypothetical protein [Luteolibacter arcticus]MCW1921450.1 hypothetical protein [Luteolibacter arcticus]
MNAADPREQEILERTLQEVRRTRRRRTTRKLAVLPLVLVGIGAGWLALQHAPPSAAGSPAVVAISQPAEPPAETFTVMEWTSGMPSLVEYSGRDLGNLELTFSLEPVVTFPEENESW